MNEAPNPYEARFEAIESVLVHLANSQKQLLTAQVIMSDRQDRTTQQLGEVVELIASLSRKVDSLAASQTHSDERLNALIAVVDDLVRKNGKRGNKPQ